MAPESPGLLQFVLFTKAYVKVVYSKPRMSNLNWDIWGTQKSSTFMYVGNYSGVETNFVSCKQFLIQTVNLDRHYKPST